MQTLTENYKGYTLTTKVTTDSDQCTLIYLGTKFIKGIAADKRIEDSISKAKNYIDKVVANIS